jgi:hypothetical protein
MAEEIPMRFFRRLACRLGFHAGYLSDGYFHCAYCDYKEEFPYPEKK